MNVDELKYDAAGLIAAVAQDARSGQVRMVGWMNADAVRTTIETGQAHFWSRSRQTLWKKGETSGNTLAVVEMRADCDADTLLLSVVAAGPTCHTGAETCFTDEPSAGFAWLEGLNATILERIGTEAADSYTARLAAEGVDGPSRKVLEEAGEVAFAAKNHAQSPSPARAHEVAAEAADLMYHLLVLLAERGIPAGAVIDELGTRSKQQPPT